MHGKLFNRILLRSGKDSNNRDQGLKWPAALSSLKYRNFRLFFSGQLISLTGTWMQVVALSWLVYRLTGSAAMLGLVAFAGQAPGFFLAPFGGVWADRKSRRRILLATQATAMALALAMACLTFFGRIEVWQIVALAALVGINSAFDLPARQAFIVDMVGKEDLLNAIALNSSAVNGARLVGPAVAGLLVAAVGEA